MQLYEVGQDKARNVMFEESEAINTEMLRDSLGDSEGLDKKE